MVFGLLGRVEAGNRPPWRQGDEGGALAMLTLGNDAQRMVVERSRA
jgi:hypothetical protein